VPHNYIRSVCHLNQLFWNTSLQNLWVQCGVIKSSVRKCWFWQNVPLLCSQTNLLFTYFWLISHSAVCDVPSSWWLHHCVWTGLLIGKKGGRNGQLDTTQTVKQIRRIMQMLLHYTWLFVGMFAKLQKRRAISFVCPSIHLSMHIEQHGSHWKDFLEIWYLGIFREPVKNIQISLKYDKNNCINKFMTSHWIYLGMRNVSDRACRENQNAHFMLTFRNRASYI
jgi:hypothetical protein